MLKGSEKNAKCSFTTFSMLPAKRDQESAWGDCKKEILYILYRSSKVISGVPLSICLTHTTKLRLPLRDLDNFECVLSNHLTEHISGTSADAWWFWFFTGCFVVVRSAGVCLDVYFSWGLFLIQFSQTWCDKCEKIKETIFHTETHGSTAWQILKKEGGLRGPRVWSIQELDSKALAEGLKANSTLKDLDLTANQIRPEGAKAWCLARMVRKKGIARSKIQALESEVRELKEIQWSNMQSGFFIDLPCGKTIIHITVTKDLQWKPGD